jgi:hypothetical protein
MMRRRGRRLAVASCAAAMLANSACYAYVPVGAPLAPEGQQVRLRLTPEGTTELARYLGPRIEGVEGTLAGVAPDGAMAVVVESVATAGGAAQPWTGEGAVIFPAAYVSGVQRSTLDRTRTTLGAVVLVGGLIAIANLALHSARSQPGPGTGAGGPPP